MIIICLFSGNGFLAFLFLLNAFADENFGKENVASSQKRRRKEVKKILLSKLLNDPLNKKLIRESNKLFGSDSFGDWSYKNHKEWLNNKIIRFENLHLKYFLYGNEIIKKLLTKYLKLINFTERYMLYHNCCIKIKKKPMPKLSLYI